MDRRFMDSNKDRAAYDPYMHESKGELAHSQAKTLKNSGIQFRKAVDPDKIKQTYKQISRMYLMGGAESSACVPTVEKHANETGGLFKSLPGLGHNLIKSCPEARSLILRLALEMTHTRQMIDLSACPKLPSPDPAKHRRPV